MNFTIRTAKPEDLTSILSVLKLWNMHHVPSLEMEEIDFEYYYVAIMNGEIVGVCGYKILSESEGKTQLLALYPEFQGSGIGKALQEKRLLAMHKKGITSVTTNADRPDIILWYKKHYGYKEVGKLKKIASFGDDSISHWTTLALDLNHYMKTKDTIIHAKSHHSITHDAHPLSPYPPLIINAAITGIIPTKRTNSHVPLSVDEIIQEAILLEKLGASIVHLHVRDKQHRPSLDPRLYEAVILGIRQHAPELICCISTSGRGGVSLKERKEVLALGDLAKPDMASLTLGSLNFLSGPSINSLETIQELAITMKKQKIKPELEIFDSGMISLANYLERHGMIEGKKYFNLILGNLNTAPATLESLTHLYTNLPENSLWAGGGLGIFQLPMNIASIVAGGHVRVGLEDNLYYDSKREVLATNESLVTRLVEFCHGLGREIASPKKARELLGLT